MKPSLDFHAPMICLASDPEDPAGHPWLDLGANQCAAVGRLGRAVILAAEGVWFSEASIREIGRKRRKGKINLQPRRILDQALRDGFRTSALDLVSILLLRELRHEHGDRFDRLLYAQARHHGSA